ncbi:TRAP transporter substrate-binding protein [Halomonas sp. 25-S5]|uniref:TRAP transporter substrate-binding protein n=1 Tax=Halomonas sp. 25-S5 TaxID=2994065 RepID=UPI00246934BC|nr:TRAP transporter substrate-binding protein [Halomonas sp. 25-S5]
MVRFYKYKKQTTKSRARSLLGAKLDSVSFIHQNPKLGKNLQRKENKPMKRLLRTLIAAGVFAGSLASASAAEINMRLATIAPPGHNWVKVSEKLSKLLEQHSGGEISLDIFPAAQLGDEEGTLQQMQSGLLDMAVVTVAGLTTREQAFNGWFTPYLFSDVADAAAGSHTAAAQEMLKRLEHYDLVGLGYVQAGMRNILTRDIAVDKIADLKNKKVRITPFSAMKVWWDGVGAVPTPMPISNVYQGLQSGVIDAIDMDMDAITSLNLQAVSKYLILTKHMAFPGAILISKSSWNRLSERQREIVTDSVVEAVDYGVKDQIVAEQRNLDNLSKTLTVERITEEAFAEANKEFHKSFSGNPLITSFQKQVQKQEATTN